MKKLYQLPLLTLYLLTLAIPIYSTDKITDGRIILNIWYNLEPMVYPKGSEYPIPKEKAIKSLLKEARIILSGMVYGYTFTYTPPDSARKIKEYFQLKPIAEIKWGDKNLTIVSTRVERKRLYTKLAYTLTEYQKLRLTGWASSKIVQSSGIGKGNLFKGQSERITSFKNAIKEAIRNYLRPRILNKPREITGEVIIRESPYLIVREGNYITNVKIKLRIKEIVPYRIF